MVNENAQNNIFAHRITLRQLSILLILFIFGDCAIFINTPNDAQHGWMAYIFGCIGGFIVLALYLWIYKLNDSQQLQMILKKCFGKIIGTIISISYALFFMLYASLVLYNYTAYTIETSFDYTPKWFILLCLGAIVFYGLFKGIKVIARTSEIFIWGIIIATLFVWIVQFGQVHFANIYPIQPISYLPIIKDAFYPFSLCFAPCVVFLMIFPLAGKVEQIKKPLFIGMGIASGIITEITLRTLLILSGPMINRYVYPIFFSYSISEDIKIGIIPASLVGLAVLIKVMILIYSSISIDASVFNLKRTSPVIIIIGMAVLVLSYFVFNTGVMLSEFLMGTWAYVVVVFAVVIPIIILIISLVMQSKKKAIVKGT